MYLLSDESMMNYVKNTADGLSALNLYYVPILASLIISHIQE